MNNVEPRCNYLITVAYSYLVTEMAIHLAAYPLNHIFTTSRRPLNFDTAPLGTNHRHLSSIYLLDTCDLTLLFSSFLNVLQTSSISCTALSTFLSICLSTPCLSA